MIITIKRLNNVITIAVPQEYSASWSSEQTRGHDDFQPASVSTIYQVFEASQSPVLKSTENNFNEKERWGGGESPNKG